MLNDRHCLCITFHLTNLLMLTVPPPCINNKNFRNFISYHEFFKCIPFIHWANFLSSLITFITIFKFFEFYYFFNSYFPNYLNFLNDQTLNLLIYLSLAHGITTSSLKNAIYYLNTLSIYHWHFLHSWCMKTSLSFLQ
jgi:hypothetical protein